jgi:hypothetical protein
MNNETINRVFERRVTMFAAALDLRDAAQAEVEALEARLEQAKRELRKADDLMMRNRGRALRCHFRVMPKCDYRKRVALVERYADEARQGNKVLFELAALVRES